MKQSAVSVVVPVYNTEKYLRKCLDSLLNQTLECLEIVAVDDGSTDECPAILDEYKAKYPEKMVVIHKSNGGQGTARNLAFQHCSGEYIGFLDSDDFVKPQMYQRMYEKACKTGADYIACGYTEFTMENQKEIILKDYEASRVVKSLEDMFIGAYASPWLHLYKREVILDNHIEFPEHLIYEDTAFYLNMIPALRKVDVIEEPFVMHLKHRNSTMMSFSKDKVANIFPVLKFSIDYYQQNHHYERFQNELEYFCVRVLLCSSMQRISRVKSWKEARELQRTTIDIIQENFSEYRKNPHIGSGMSNIYMKCFNRFTAPFFLLGMRFVNRFHKSYS